MKYLLILTFIFLCSIVSFGQNNIHNFAQVDEKVFRGAQPSQEDMVTLKELGIKTIINLRDDPDPNEAKQAKALGINYINIPMSGYLYPSKKTVQKAENILNSPASGKVFVHCKAGIHRTGVIIAVYRIDNYNWTYDEAKKEMKDRLWFGFSSVFHLRLKDYAEDYAERKSSQYALKRAN